MPAAAGDNGRENMNAATTKVCEESATTAISMLLSVPVTVTQAKRLTTLWNDYFAAAVAHYSKA